MHRWFGSSSDSDRQASERDSRAARRTIRELRLSSDSEDDYGDAETSLHVSLQNITLNLDGQGDENESGSEAGSDTTMADAEAAAELARQRALPVAESDFENDPDSWKKEVKIKFDSDINYWFNSVEAQMKKHGINRQWDKKDTLAALLPDHIIEECKPILRLTEAEAGPHIYKTLKTEILSIFGPRDEDVFKKAIALRLTSTPSALGKKLIHLICPGAKPFEGCHCAKIVYGFWDNNLTVPIKTALAGQSFNKDTYQALFKLADQVFIANGGAVASAVPAVVGAVATPNTPVTTPQTSNDNPQVAAVRGGGRGRGQRGGRGGRGRGGNRGASNSQNQPANNNSSSNSSNKPHQKGDKHPDLPARADWACAQHWRKGRGAPYCSDPLVCQWVSVVAPRSSNA